MIQNDQLTELTHEVELALASQADWTPSIVTEREVEYRRKKVVHHDWVALTVGASVISALAIFGIWASIQLLAAWSVIPIILLIIGLSYAARNIDRRRERLQKEAADADRILQDEFGSGEGWLVDLKIIQGAAPTGEDRGMLWFEDGRMVFSGHRTSFALSSSQADDRCRFENKVPGLRHSWALKLKLRTEAGPVFLSFEPPANQHDVVPGAINHWVESTPVADGQFPPTKLGPGAPTLGHLLMKAVVSTAYWLGLLYLAFLPATWNAFAIIFALGAVVALYLRLWFPFTRWRAWASMRRVKW